MGGGLMQLVAMGAQDVYLTGNPQITFFKVVYRRHTNFSKECIEQTFSGSIPETGTGSVTCTLARNGDLVQEIYLKATLNATDETPLNLPAVHNTNDTTANTITLTDSTSLSVGDEIAFNKNISTTLYNADDSVDTTTVRVEANKRYFVLTNNAHAITITETKGSSVAVVIPVTTGAVHVGGVVDTTYDLQAGTTITKQGLVLNKDITDLIKTVEVEIGGQKIDKHYSQWLDIYNELFETSHDYRNAMSLGTPGNNKTVYIPLRFWFNRNPGLALPLIALQYHEVKVLMDLNVPANSTLSTAKLLVNYLYLDTDERRRFAQVSHEYLIEQVQHTGVETEGPIDMNFNHPVKALFWTAGANPGNVKLQLNGHDRAAEQPHDYYHLVQPYECDLGHCGKSLHNTDRTWGQVVNSAATQCVGMYSFCLKPAEHQPSGTCNFSRIDNARLNVGTVTNLYLFALNYNVLRIMSGMGGLAYSN